jgi:hypothetical protein
MNTEKLKDLCARLPDKPKGKITDLEDTEVRLVGILLEPEPILCVSVPGYKSPWQIKLDQWTE